MNIKTYNYITLTSFTNKFKIHDNILNQEICTIERKSLQSYYNDNIIENIALYISDLEEINYRLETLISKYLHNKISQENYLKKIDYLYSEIGARFNHYFKAEDTPMVAAIICKIAETTRQNDFVYEHFSKHCLQYIQKKNKEKLYFEAQNPNSFDDAISNYA